MRRSSRDWSSSSSSKSFLSPLDALLNTCFFLLFDRFTYLNDVSKWIYGFLWSGRGESRERGLPPKERERYLRLRSNKHVHQTWLWPPPLFFYEMVLFFSTTNFTLLSQKNKKKQKKSKRVGGRVILIFTFSTHARTRTRVNMSSAVSDSARVVRLFISSLFVRAASTREGSFCGRRIVQRCPK